MRVTDRTKLSEATGRALFNPVQFVSALFNGRVADGFLNLCGPSISFQSIHRGLRIPTMPGL